MENQEKLTSINSDIHQLIQISNHLSDFSKSEILQHVEKLRKKKELLLKQYDCNHEEVTGLISFGEVDNKKIFKNYCLLCGKQLNIKLVNKHDIDKL